MILDVDEHDLWDWALSFRNAIGDNIEELAKNWEETGCGGLGCLIFFPPFTALIVGLCFLVAAIWLVAMLFPYLPAILPIIGAIRAEHTTTINDALIALVCLIVGLLWWRVLFVVHGGDERWAPLISSPVPSLTLIGITFVAIDITLAVLPDAAVTCSVNAATALHERIDAASALLWIVTVAALTLLFISADREPAEPIRRWLTLIKRFRATVNKTATITLTCSLIALQGPTAVAGTGTAIVENRTDAARAQQIARHQEEQEDTITTETLDLDSVIAQVKTAQAAYDSSQNRPFDRRDLIIIEAARSDIEQALEGHSTWGGANAEAPNPTRDTSEGADAALAQLPSATRERLRAQATRDEANTKHSVRQMLAIEILVALDPTFETNFAFAGRLFTAGLSEAQQESMETVGGALLDASLTDPLRALNTHLKKHTFIAKILATRLGHTFSRLVDHTVTHTPLPVAIAAIDHDEAPAVKEPSLPNAAGRKPKPITPYREIDPRHPETNTDYTAPEPPKPVYNAIHGL